MYLFLFVKVCVFIFLCIYFPDRKILVKIWTGTPVGAFPPPNFDKKRYPHEWNSLQCVVSPSLGFWSRLTPGHAGLASPSAVLVPLADPPRTPPLSRAVAVGRGASVGRLWMGSGEVSEAEARPQRAEYEGWPGPPQR